MFKKSLLTLALFALVGIISAQNIQFEYEGTVYTSGQTVICPYDEAMGEYVLHLGIRNLGDTEANVVVHREIFEMPEDGLTFFCWGMCYDPTVDMSRGVPVAPQTLAEEELSVHFMIPEGGLAKMNFYAYDENAPENIISLYLMAGNGAGVTENTLTLGSAYPNPASTQVHFDCKAGNGDDVNVVVYNLLGQEVKSQMHSSVQGRINIDVDDLTPGIYFCSFVVNNAVVKTEKFIVKR